jgi:hypothetical protein
MYHMHCSSSINRLRQLIPAEQVELLKILRQHLGHSVDCSAYNWVRPSLWTSIFAKTSAAAAGPAGDATAGKL